MSWKQIPGNPNWEFNDDPQITSRWNNVANHTGGVRTNASGSYQIYSQVRRVGDSDTVDRGEICATHFNAKVGVRGVQLAEYYASLPSVAGGGGGVAPQASNVEFLRAGTNTGTLAEGEFAVVYVGGGNGGIVSVPSGWTLHKRTNAGGGSPFYGAIGYKTTPGTLSVVKPFGAKSVVWAVYSGVDIASPFGADAAPRAAVGSVTSGVTTLTRTDGTSVVINFVGNRGATIPNSSAPGGTVRAGQSGVPGSVAIGDIKPVDGQTTIDNATYYFNGTGAITRIELVGTTV
jgi:hypothetical protein